MQPTNTDVDYEQALKNYFHYDIQEIYHASRNVLRACEFSRNYLYAAHIDCFIHDMMGIDKSMGDYRMDRNAPKNISYVEASNARMDAYQLQEYIYDWNDVCGECNTECRLIDSIIEEMNEVIENNTMNMNEHRIWPQGSMFGIDRARQ